MLRQLAEYASRLPRPPVLYSPATVRYAILIDGSGRLLSETPLELSDPASPKLKGLKMLLPQVQKTSGVRANLLNGNAEYTLAIGRPGSKPTDVQKRHDAYLRLVQRCAEQTHDPTVAAVLTFLEENPREQLQFADDFAPDGTIVFRVDGQDPLDRPAVQAFWASENDPAAKDAPTMQCIVCGHMRPVLRVLPQKVKGLRRGNAAGTSLISANRDPFFSYGQENSLVAPTCGSCAEAFTNGLNDLLSDTRSCIRLGGAEIVFWTREDVGFSMLTFLDDPNPEEVRGLLRSVTSGAPRPDVDATAFFAAVLSGSKARAVVREWIDQTVGDAKAALAAWFADHEVVDEWGGEPRPFGLAALAGAAVRDPTGDVTVHMVPALMQAALRQTPISPDFLARALRRAAAGSVTVAGRRIDRLSHRRAALIKLVLARHGMSREEVHHMTQLAPDHPNPAYHCGRLLAVLDAVQRAALGPVNATIVDRYFGTASSAPGTVFPYLIRGSAPHLAKLRKTRPGAYQALQQRLEEVIDRLPTFKPVLTLQEQGLFALGYYHQRADDRRRIREAAEGRKAAASTTDQTAPADAGDLTDEEFSS
jgi:CRISPR-associated protein Csd1